MERGQTYSIEEILDRVRCGELQNNRLRNFAENGTTCVSCGLEAEFFAEERHEPEHPYHFNLYALDGDDEILMTKDHIIPKSKGGANCIENYQPMCASCNNSKGDELTEVAARRGVRQV